MTLYFSNFPRFIFNAQWGRDSSNKIDLFERSFEITDIKDELMVVTFKSMTSAADSH